MKIESKRFGSIEVRDDRIITVKGGLLGFPNHEQYVVVDDVQSPEMPFRWLVSVDEPEIGFLVTDPGIFFKDYVFDLPEEDRTAIAATNEDEVSVLTLLSIPTDPKQITANLRGPVVINNTTLQARQVVLVDTRYTTKHFIFVQEPATESNPGEATTAATSESAVALVAINATASEHREVNAN